MDVPRVTNTASPEVVVEALKMAGCVVIDHAVDDSAMDDVAAEIEGYIDRTPMGSDDFAGFRTRRTGSLIARSPSFRPLATHPSVIAALDRVLGDHTTNYQLHLTQVIEIGPDEPGQLIHRDQWAFDFFPFPAGFEVECHCMWALTDFTDANGATRVIPGSHKWEDRLRPTYDQSVPAEMSKGSVLLYIGSLYHGGGANRSAGARRGINVGYTLSWLRQEENQYLACPLEVARTLDDDLLRLMGYTKAAYALGYYGDLRDPMDAVRGENISVASFSPR